MKEQFAVDEQRWRKWWGEKKAFWLSTKPLIMLLKAKGAFQYAILSGELSPLPLWQHLLALPIRFIFKNLDLLSSTMDEWEALFHTNL